MKKRNHRINIFLLFISILHFFFILFGREGGGGGGGGGGGARPHANYAECRL